MEIKSVEAAYIGASLMTDGAIPVLEGRMFYTPLWRDCRDSGIRDLSLLLAEFDEHKDEILRAVDQTSPAMIANYAVKIRAAWALRSAKNQAFAVTEATTTDELRYLATSILEKTEPEQDDIDIFEELLDTLDKPPTVYLTGSKLLDRLLGGLRPGNVVVVGGATSMGKTAYLVSMMAAMDHPAIFATAEMGRGEIAERLMAHISGVPLATLRARALDDRDWKAVTDSAASWSKRTVTFREIASPSDIHPEKGWVIFVDYLQFLTCGEKNPYADVRAVSKALKSLAVANESPVVVACQLNRGPESRKDHEPRLSDLRDSGTIAQDADQVIFPYRPSEYGATGGVELIVAKNRHGPKGRTPLVWHETTASFSEPYSPELKLVENLDEF